MNLPVYPIQADRGQGGDSALARQRRRRLKFAEVESFSIRRPGHLGAWRAYGRDELSGSAHARNRVELEGVARGRGEPGGSGTLHEGHTGAVRRPNRLAIKSRRPAQLERRTST